MEFQSLTFLYIFLPLCLLFYFITKNITVRNVVLLIFSLIFYAVGEPVYVFLMITTVLIDYIGALLVEKYRETKLSKLFLGLSVGITLSFLAFFKYIGFFTENVNSLFSTSIPVLELSLPIGISFYTFQALTYVVDVYKGRTPVQKSFYKLLLYVSMFPQLVCGPIVRYSDVDRQLSERTSTVQSVASGMVRVCTGLLKKLIIADYACKLRDLLIGPEVETFSFVGALVGITAFAIQIYFDFSGYSDVAIGLGKIFGFDFPENFNYPYIASSVSDFWRRWHISMSSFFRDYVYIPLGGNRNHWARNMLIVWLLTGLWHGASWNCVLWGLYYFFFLMLEKLYIGEILKKKYMTVISHIYTIAVILVGWAFFFFKDMQQLREFFRAITFSTVFVTSAEKQSIINHMFILIAGAVLSLPFAKLLRAVSTRLYAKRSTAVIVNIVIIAFVVFALLVITSTLIGSSLSPNMYTDY